MRARRILSAYSSIIMKNIALFLASGILNILFSGNGWFPNRSMQAFGVLLSDMVIPLFLAYSAGQKSGKFLGQPVRSNMGGIAGVLTGCCLLTHNRTVSMLTVIILAAVAGYLSSWIFNHILNRFPVGFEMMGRNLITVSVGLALGILSSILILPVLGLVNEKIMPVLGMVCSSSLLFLANLLIEPLKVFFLNNSLNHGILIPLGMNQIKEAGSSILFLMETNPGPGLGILSAYWLVKKDERNSLLPLMAAHGFGGIHEVYFPYVLLDLRLLAAVMVGGVCGTFAFSWMGVGAVGPISPGSVLTVLMMVSVHQWGKVLAGIFVSALISGMVALYLLKGGEKATESDDQMDNGAEEAMELKTEERTGNVQMGLPESRTENVQMSLPESRTENVQMGLPESIEKIYVVCDAGMGSSAMGAALLRKQLRAEGILEVQVRAAAADDIPKGGDLIVCQKDFYDQCLKESKQDLPFIYTVDQLAHRTAYNDLVEQLCRIRKLERV